MKSALFAVVSMFVFSGPVFAQMIPNPGGNLQQQATQANVAASTQIASTTNLKNATTTIVTTAPNPVSFWSIYIDGNPLLSDAQQWEYFQQCTLADMDQVDALAMLNAGNVKLAAAISNFTSGTTAQFVLNDYGLAISWYGLAKQKAIEASQYYGVAGTLMQSTDQVISDMMLEFGL